MYLIHPKSIDPITRRQTLTQSDKAPLKIFKSSVCSGPGLIVLLTPAPAGPGDPGVPPSPRGP